MYFRKQGYKYAIILMVIMVITSLTENDLFARRYMLMNQPEFNYRFSYEYDKEKRTSPFSNREDKAITFQEGFDFKTNGWIYHPALMTYTLRYSPEWEQLSQETKGQDKAKTDNFLQGYFTDLTLFQFKPYSFRFFAGRRRLTVSSNLARKSKNNIDTYGTSIYLKYPVLPTTLDYSHTGNDQTGFFEFKEDINDVRVQMRYSRHLGDTTVLSSYKDTSTNLQGSTTDLKEQKVNLYNVYDVSDNGTLRSDLGYRNSEGDFIKLDKYSISENLSLRHRENLKTNYNFRYVKNDFETSENRTKSLGFNLTHLLYENLTTTINTIGIQNEFSGIDEKEYGGGINFNYRRRIPWGALNLNMGQNYMKNEIDKMADFIDIREEDVPLFTGTITLLQNENVSVDSIIVRNEQNPAIVYQEGIDYRIEELGSSIRISRTGGGNISEGQTVLVDYTYESSPAFDFLTKSSSYGISLNLWSVWNIHYNVHRKKEKFLSGTLPGRLIDDTIYSAGTEVNWKWSKTHFVYVDSDTTSVPKKEWRAGERINFKPSRRYFFSISGLYGETEFLDIEETETFKTYSSSIQMLTSEKSRLTLKGFWNSIVGPAADNTSSGYSLIFDFAYRILRGKIEYSNAHENDKRAQDDTRNEYVMFEVKTVRF